MGRPSDYSAETADKICDLLASGMGLAQACAGIGMPNARTVHRWLEKHEEFRQSYARARNEQADHYADAIVHIADTETDYNVARVRIDARKWHAAHLAPKKYSDKYEHVHKGDADSPMQIFVSSIGKSAIPIKDD